MSSIDRTCPLKIKCFSIFLVKLYTVFKIRSLSKLYAWACLCSKALVSLDDLVGEVSNIASDRRRTKSGSHRVMVLFLTEYNNMMYYLLKMLCFRKKKTINMKHIILNISAFIISDIYFVFSKCII